MSILSPGRGPEPGRSPTLSAPDTVLIAEDDPISRRILETWLQKRSAFAPLCYNEAYLRWRL
jgi:hypothetical protein